MTTSFSILAIVLALASSALLVLHVALKSAPPTACAGNSTTEGIMNIQDIVNTVSNTADIDPMTTEKVVGTILSVLRHETEGTSVEQMFDKIPGSLDLAQKYDVMAAGPASNGGGGLLGSLTSALGGALGEKTGALVKGLSALEASGLTLDQIQKAGAELVEQAKAAAGPAAVNQALAQVPSLKSQLGL